MLRFLSLYTLVQIQITYRYGGRKWWILITAWVVLMIPWRRYALYHVPYQFCYKWFDERNSVHTWKPARVISSETSSGGLTTPATDFTRDIKSSGNQTIQINSTTIIPPIPYFTTFFFFWPRGWGYLCRGMRYRTVSSIILPGFTAKQLLFFEIHYNYAMKWIGVRSVMMAQKLLAQEVLADWTGKYCQSAIFTIERHRIKRF